MILNRSLCCVTHQTSDIFKDNLKKTCKKSCCEHFFSFICFWRTRGSFSLFSPLLPLTEFSPQPSAIPGGNPPGDWQSVVSWGGAGFEPGTVGQQSGMLPLSHHASQHVNILYRLDGQSWPEFLSVQFIRPVLSSADPSEHNTWGMFFSVRKLFYMSAINIFF